MLKIDEKIVREFLGTETDIECLCTRMKTSRIYFRNSDTDVILLIVTPLMEETNESKNVISNIIHLNESVYKEKWTYEKYKRGRNTAYVLKKA